MTSEERSQLIQLFRELSPYVVDYNRLKQLSDAEIRYQLSKIASQLEADARRIREVLTNIS